MSDMKRRVTILAAVLVVATIGVAAWWLLMPVRPINKQNFDRLEVGMSRREVEALLGGPARDESTGTLLSREPLENGDSEVLAELKAELFCSTIAWSAIRPTKTCWRCDTAQIAVEWDDNGRVWSKEFMAVRRKYEGPWATVRRWLRI